MGKSGGSTTVQTTEPWAEQKPYLVRGFQQAMGDPSDPKKFGLMTDPLQYYSGDKVASFTPAEMLAQGLTAQRAIAGNPMTAQAQGVFRNAMGGGLNVNPDTSLMAPTARGSYLNANPYIDAQVGKAQQNLLSNYFNTSVPLLNTQAQKSGRFGSGAWAQLAGNQQSGLMQNLSNIAADMYGQNYARERGLQEGASQYLTGLGASQGNQNVERMLGAAQVAPALGREDYTDFQQLAGVGAAQRQYNQALLDEARNAFEFQQMEPWNRAAMGLGLVQGNYGGSVTSPYYQNRLMSGLGGAASGAALGSMVAPGIGTGVGALAGGMIGLL